MNYDISTPQLDEHSPRSLQPPAAAVSLRPHQLAMLHKLRCMETGKICVNGLTDDESSDVLETSIGIIGDSVGSGKSFVILSMILTDTEHPVAARSRDIIQMMGVSHVVYKKHVTYPVAYDSTLLVIPHNICSQWEKYVHDFAPDLPYVSITRTKQVQSVRLQDFASKKLVIVSSTFFASLAGRIITEGVRFRRIVFDEADSINLPSCPELDCDFTWFVTASYGNLLYPRGFKLRDYRRNEYVCMAKGLCGNGFIRRIFLNMKDAHIARLLVARNSDSFIHQSINLPPIVSHYVRCRTPVSIGMLQGYVDTRVIALLNAGDVTGAMDVLNPTLRTSQNDIVSACVSHYTNTMARLGQQKTGLEQMLANVSEGDAAQELWRHELARISDSIDALKNRIDGIQNRIQEAEMCGICLEQLSNKAVVPCCAVTFCFPCIMRCISTRKSCPLCKKTLEAKHLLIARPANPENLSDDSSDEGGTSSENDKLQNLLVLLENSAEDAKILIFASFDNSLLRIASILSTNNIRYAYLKGNISQINCTVASYARGDVRVLLVNSRNYGSGLDLSMTTDVVMFHKLDNEIENQVIGRAQRIGRNTNLNVWYLLYENEMGSTVAE